MHLCTRIRTHGRGRAMLAESHVAGGEPSARHTDFFGNFLKAKDLPLMNESTKRKRGSV